MRHAFLLDLAVDERAASDLSADGVFIPNATVELDEECHIVLRAGAEELTFVGRAVHVTEEGTGFHVEGMSAELRARIAGLVALARHADLGRKQTLTGSIADIASRRTPAGSIPPATRRGAERRMAEGSISPIAAFAPTRQDEALADKARSAQRAARADTDGDAPSDD